MNHNTNKGLTIGALAKAAGVGVETVRYYERRGLLPQPSQMRGAFRVYGEHELARLRAVRRAQQLGFSLEEIDSLLALNEDTDRARARTLAQSKIALLDERIRQMQEMRNALTELVGCCQRTDETAPCPILRALSGD